MTEWILTSSILILVVIALRTCFKGKISLRLQYAIWGLVLLRLLIPFSFGSTDISVANLTISNAPPAMQATTSPNIQNTPNPSHEDLENEITDRYEELGIDVEVHVDGPLDMKALLRDALPVIWAVGFVVVAGLFLVTNLRFRRKIMDSRFRLDVRKNNLDVYATDAIDTPCLFGIRNPAIYVTWPVADDPTLLRHTLEHEATHHRHGDHIWSILRCVCLAIHWYNPLVWWAAFLSQRDAELACDETTIKRLGEGERAEYGRTLIGMTCQKRANVLATATTMNSGKSGLKERIMLIAKKPKMALYTLLIVVLVAAIAVGCTFTGARNNWVEAYAQLDDYLIDYSYELVKDRMDREDIHFLGSWDDYALVYCAGMGPTLNLYRYEIDGDQIIVTDRASGDYAISGGLSVNHLVDGDKHIYFGTISDSHWVPEDDTRIPLGWTDLVFWDAEGTQKVLTIGTEGYLCVLDSPISDFWVVVNGGDVPLKMEQYLEQGYLIREAGWYSDQADQPTSEPTQAATEPTPTEIPDDAPPVNIPEMLHEQPDWDKVCIQVLPTGSISGEHFKYIIPENQELLLEYYQDAVEHTAEDLMIDSDLSYAGWWIKYQDVTWYVMSDGSMQLWSGGVIASEHAKELYDFCTAAIREAGIGEPVRPEDISGIKSATLHWNGVHTITDPYALKEIETWFSNSRESMPGRCWLTDLVLELDNGETLNLSVAADSCAYWMSNGAYYGFGEITNVGIEGNEKFYSLFATDIIHEKAQEGPDAMAEYWVYMNWGLYARKYGHEDTMALLYMFEDHVLSNPTDWNIYVTLTCGRGLDGAYAEFYSYLIGELFEAAPATFNFACRQMVPEQYVEDAVNSLAYYWSITPEEARARLEDAKNSD